MTCSDGILLVCMPFGNVFSPSIGLSLLKAELAAEGISARVLYPSILFAELVGQDFYYKLSTGFRPSVSNLAGEWIFSRALFGSRADDQAYVDEILGKRTSWSTSDSEEPASPALVAGILRAREAVDGFLERCWQEIVRGRPRVVGFSSMSQQHVASLAVARLVKQSLPETFVVFGGAHCADVMGAETVRRFPFVDAAVSGEADLVFPDLVRRVLEGQSLSNVPGVRTHDEAEPADGVLSHAPPAHDLDSLPYPDYGDYFRQFEASRYGHTWQPRIYLETSRGCWWGEKSHCTFCGLDSRDLAFRRKSPGRALDELDWLTSRHPGCAVEATDNVLDMGYLSDFVPALASRRRRVPLFYEVRANLGKDDLRRLRAAGIRAIQPGIESLSDPVLRLVRKGTTALQNIQLLKWCRELGIEATWNILWGFPGEPPEEYARMADLVPLLAHLPPPGGCGVMRLDRFSPAFEDAGPLGFANVVPLPAYRHVYALPEESLERLACFFTFGYREPHDVRAYVGRLERTLRDWPSLHRKHALFSVDRGGSLLVWDTRPASRAPLTALRGVDRLLYQACDATCGVRGLTEAMASRTGENITPAEVERRLEPLLHRGLMMRDGSRYLALAIPLGDYSPPVEAVERFRQLARRVGRRVRGGWVVSPDAVSRGASGKALRRPRPRGRRARRDLRLTPAQFSIDARGNVLFREFSR